MERSVERKREILFLLLLLLLRNCGGEGLGATGSVGESSSSSSRSSDSTDPRPTVCQGSSGISGVSRQRNAANFMDSLTVESALWLGDAERRESRWAREIVIWELLYGSFQGKPVLFSLSELIGGFHVSAALSGRKCGCSSAGGARKLGRIGCFHFSHVLPASSRISWPARSSTKAALTTPMTSHLHHGARCSSKTLAHMRA